MDHTQYNEQFANSELGRSGNEIINTNRDHRESHQSEPTHWDITEMDDDGEIHRFHVMDSEQTWLPDF